MELVIAVSIVSLLIAIVSPALAKQIQRAKEAKYLAEAKNVSAALQLYLLDLEEQGKTVSEWGLSVILQEEPISSSKNVLYPYLSHEATRGAYIYSITIKKSYLSGLYYSVNDYKIMVDAAGEATVVEYPVSVTE